MAPNLALLSIPAFYALVLRPSGVALMLILRADRRGVNNVNPRGVATPEAYRKLLGPPAFAKWERCKAANINGYECFSLFAASMLGGLYAGISPRAMNWLGLWGVLLRAVYNELYMRTEGKRASFWRTGVYWAQMVSCLGLLCAAAWTHGAKEES